MILKRAETYLTVLSSISIFLIFFNWSAISQNSPHKLAPHKAHNIEEVWKSDDFKIITPEDKLGHKWTLGELRRYPLEENFHNVLYDDLPKLRIINNSINSHDLIGTINRTSQVTIIYTFYYMSK